MGIHSESTRGSDEETDKKRRAKERERRKEVKRRISLPRFLAFRT
jgi:hypothetical protein